MAKGSNIEPWEAALIKAMREGGRLNRDQTISYFTRPDRTVNPARVSEIESGDLHSDVAPANAAQLEAYLRTYKTPIEARQRFFEENPLHSVNLESLFRLKAGTMNILQIGETDRIECKEGINFGHKAALGRVIASLNNSSAALAERQLSA